MTRKQPNFLPVVLCKECGCIAHKAVNILGFRDGRVRCICGWQGKPWRSSEQEYLAHLEALKL
jgi:hypothetical protein